MELAPIGQKENPGPHLWDTVKGTVDEAIASSIPEVVQRLDHFLDYIVATVVEYIGHILHKQSERPERPDIGQIAEEQISTRIHFVCFGMVGNLAQLRTSDPRVRLAGRSPDQH